MLKAYINNTGRPVLQVVLDVPVPESVRRAPPIEAWLTAMDRIDDVTLHINDQGLAGFELPLEQWRSVVSFLQPDRQVAMDALFDALLPGIDNTAAEGLDVNFHQKPFDTPERYWRFILGQGHFFEYLLNRLYWYLAPRHGIVTPFPLHVDIETANTCNMNCPMCYRDRIEEVGQMKFNLFRKAIDECVAEDVFSVRLSWRGEPLTHPRIKEMIAYAAARIKNVSFLTNAFYLTDDIIECLVKNQVSYVAVSFDGIGATYETIRHPAKFEESRQKLSKLRQFRNLKGSSRPQVRVCTVWPAINDDPQAYADAMRPVCDYMVYNPYINFHGPMTLKEGFICQYPWERMMIAWNGKVQCCTGWNARDIVLGNLSATTIKTFWNSEAMAQIRNIHWNGERMDLESCARCRHGSLSDPDVKIGDIVARRF